MKRDCLKNAEMKNAGMKKAFLSSDQFIERMKNAFHSKPLQKSNSPPVWPCRWSLPLANFAAALRRSDSNASGKLGHVARRCAFPDVSVHSYNILVFEGLKCSNLKKPSQTNSPLESRKKMASKRIAVVTGGNKGVGLEICKQLANEVVVVLTARDDKRGTDAVAQLHSSGFPDVIFHQLDVTNLASIASLANFIEARFGKLDILVRNLILNLVPVNNAGIASTIVDEESFWSLNLPSEVIGVEAKQSNQVVAQTFEGAQNCLETNYYGAKHVTQALLTLLLKSTSPRIVNISSKLGQLHHVEDESAQKILSDFDGLTEEVVDGVVSEFSKDAKDDKLLEKKGWTSNLSGYIVSKAALNAYTRIVSKKFPSISANVVSPGFVATDMTHFKGTSTPEKGAKGPVRLALGPDGGPSGQYFWTTEKSTF
ncbi:hypothetical protein LXL04_026468 [Taraxacum kok-saghyz]